MQKTQVQNSLATVPVMRTSDEIYMCLVTGTDSHRKKYMVFDGR